MEIAAAGGQEGTLVAGGQQGTLDGGVQAPIPVVELVGVTKVFGPTIAAQSVSFGLYSGEVLALVGENGAGKSTLVKTVGGVYRPDDGYLKIAGEKVDLHSPLDASHRGIAVVHQHPGLFPDLSIAENVFAGRPLRNSAGLLDHARMRAEAQKWIDMLGLTRSAANTVSSLRTSEQQMVEIARALAADAKVLILDEPTAALTIGEVEKLFAVIDDLRTRGVAMMFVGHRLEEIFAVSDRIAILRDGKLIDTRNTRQTDQVETVKLMVGRDLGDLYPVHQSTIGAPVLTVSDLSVRGSFEQVDFTVRAGEVVGLAGLVGSGRTEIARVIFGIDRPSTGTVTLDDQPLKPRSAADAMARGIAYVSEDRRGQSLIEEFSILDNATLPVITKATRPRHTFRAAPRAAHPPARRLRQSGRRGRRVGRRIRRSQRTRHRPNPASGYRDHPRLTGRRLHPSGRREVTTLVTMRDVARKAGVSSATVSHVLNGTRKVNAETAEAVRNAHASHRLRQRQPRPSHAHRHHPDHRPRQAQCQLRHHGTAIAQSSVVHPPDATRAAGPGFATVPASFVEEGSPKQVLDHPQHQRTQAFLSKILA